MRSNSTCATKGKGKRVLHDGNVDVCQWLRDLGDHIHGAYFRDRRTKNKDKDKDKGKEEREDRRGCKNIRSVISLEHQNKAPHEREMVSFFLSSSS